MIEENTRFLKKNGFLKKSSKTEKLKNAGIEI